MTALEVLRATGFDAFADLLSASAYRDVIDAAGFTIFAPSDEAFAEFSAGGRNGGASPVLGYHFAAGRVRSEQFLGKRIRAVMYAAGDVIVDGRNGLRVNDVKLVRPDIDAGASIVHGIDGVLWPAASQRSPQ